MLLWLLSASVSFQPQRVMAHCVHKFERRLRWVCVCVCVCIIHANVWMRCVRYKYSAIFQISGGSLLQVLPGSHGKTEGNMQSEQICHEQSVRPYWQGNCNKRAKISGFSAKLWSYKCSLWQTSLMKASKPAIPIVFAHSVFFFFFFFFFWIPSFPSSRLPLFSHSPLLTPSTPFKVLLE